MDSNTEHLYFQKLQELVNDADKIITFRLAATEFDVSVQAAQDLLAKFVKDNNNLSVTYVLSGILKSSKEEVICLVKDQDLEKKTSLLENKHVQEVYSVQKTKNIDQSLIALANKEVPNEEALNGSVVSKNCTKRDIKTPNLPSPPPSTVKGKSTVFSKFVSKSESTTDAIKKQDIKQTKSGGTADLFNKSSKNSEPKVEKENLSQKNSKPKTGGLSGFLTKSSNESIKEKSVDKENKLTQNENKKQDFNMDVDSNEEVKEKKETPIKVKAEKKTKNKRPRKENYSGEQPVKKRKRILERNDSDSDDIFEKDDDEAEIVEDSDHEPEPVKIAPKPPLAPKNKRRKAVDKTYEDEEGFIVTKTEYIYETASEEEIEEVKPTQVEPKPKIQKKNSSNSETDISPKKGGKKGKKDNSKNQPTLMNFFKKK